MALGDGQTLHGWELVAASCVCDLEGAHALVAADHLAVGVLHCGDVGVPKSALHKAQDQGALPNPSCPEHHHTIVVALLRHSALFDLRQCYTCDIEGGGEGKCDKGWGE